jgi:dienelactone hydrolase
MKNGMIVIMVLVLAAGFLCVDVLADEKGPKIVIDPANAVYGTPFSLKVAGLNPGEVVSLAASSTDARGIKWESRAEFKADETGSIDPAHQIPVKGDYSEEDALGLLWSMKPAGIDKPIPYSHDREKGLSVSFTLTDSGKAIASSELIRYYENPENKLACIELDEDGLKGFLYSPDTGKKYPGIILLGGSNGGAIKWMAKAIASDGFSVLTLPYWKYPGLPENLVNIPLEYFVKATEWLNNQKPVKKGQIGLIGGSRGGELVLLLGSMFDKFKAIVAWVPAAHLWQGMEFTRLVPCWTYKGKALPFLGTVVSEEELKKFYTRQITTFRQYFEKDLKNSDPERIAKATIPVEKIKAPILMVSGTDDWTWPSTEFSEMIIERLKKHGFKFEHKHVKGINAGHQVFIPDFIPNTFRSFNGGTRKAELKWGIKSWNETLRFLHRHLDK